MRHEDNAKRFAPFLGHPHTRPDEDTAEKSAPFLDNLTRGPAQQDSDKSSQRPAYADNHRRVTQNSTMCEVFRDEKAHFYPPFRQFMLGHRHGGHRHYGAFPVVAGDSFC